MSDTLDAAVGGDSTTSDVVVDVITGDTTGENNPSTQQEELFEVHVGKDNKGQPIVRKFNKADLIKHAGLGVSSHEKFEQSRKLRADMEALAIAMKDPERVWEILKGLGHDTDSLLQTRVERAIAEASEDPKDKELRLTKEERDKLLKDVTGRQKAEQQAQEQAATAHFTKLLSEKVQGALKEAKLPDTKANRAAVAQIIDTLWNQKNEAGEQLFPRPLQIPNDKIMSYLKKNRVDGLKSLIEGADEDGILALLPEDLQDQIAKAVSKRLQAKQGKVDNTVKNDASPTPKKDDKRKVKTTAEQEAEIKETVRKAQILWEKKNGKR